jgi:phospholipid/cholesterol/gamma-HCH transport system substrate-binding protein
MENRAYAFIAGLFALLLCSGLVAGFWWLGGAHIAQTEYEVLSRYPVPGLNPQAVVRYRGVNVGHVGDIQVDPADPRAIIIRISIDSRLRLTRGSYAKLASQGLTGLSYIEIDDRGDDPAPLGHERIPLRESELSELLTAGKALVEKTARLEDDAGRLLNKLDRLLDDRTIEKIDRLITNMERSSAALTPLLHASRTTADKAGRLFDGIDTRALTETLHAIRQSAASIQQTSDAARPAIHQLQHDLEEFVRIGRHIDAVSTELGDILTDETLPEVHRLTRQLNRDAQTLQQLLDTLEQNPQSLIFGRPQSAPGPGEQGFQP